MRTHQDLGEQSFFADAIKKYPEFEAHFKKYLENGAKPKIDLIQFLMENADFINKDENKWMESVMQVVRKTSMFLQPQIRTKIMNEGWASYWHENLFLPDERIKGHEFDFARVNSAVTSLPRVGLNPYALGMRLFYYIEEIADKGKYSLDFKRRSDLDGRKKFDAKTGKGQEFIFKVRENFSDSMLINTFVDQDFVTKNKLFVAGKKLNSEKMVWKYYVKSRKAQDYRQMLQNSLYHPPHITVDPEKNVDNKLYLVHHFEEKPLVKDFIFNTMMGIEYLWGGPVQLETSEVVPTKPAQGHDAFFGYPSPSQTEEQMQEVQWERVLYTMQDRELTRKKLV